jgi:hypothetical protein
VFFLYPSLDSGSRIHETPVRAYSGWRPCDSDYSLVYEFPETTLQRLQELPRNRRRTMQSDQPTDEVPVLPSLEPGIQLLEVEGDGHVTGPLQSLVLDHLLLEDGDAQWVDAKGHATTRPLARIAPSRRTLDRIWIARAFTPWQHYALVDDLGEVIGAEVSLLVVPAVDAMYRDDELWDGEGRELFLRSLAKVAQLGRDHDLPVLVTRTAADEFAAPIEAATDRTIGVEHTKFGPRFVGDDVETLVYPDGNHGMVQTTLDYWARVLRNRHPGSTVLDDPTATAMASASGLRERND